MIISGVRTGLLATMGAVLLVTSGCVTTGSDEDAASSAVPSSSPSADASDEVEEAAAIDETFTFTDGTTTGMLARPWTTTDEIDGLLFHQLPGSPGVAVPDAVWGDVIVYVPDAAYGPGATGPEPMPADPVAWTAAHTDLEILDQRQITVDGVAATQIDARAITPTNWLTVGGEAFEWAGEERVVLIPLSGSWLVVRGSAFEPDAAFSDPPAPGDAFDLLVQSVDIAD